MWDGVGEGLIIDNLILGLFSSHASQNPKSKVNLVGDKVGAYGIV